MAIIRVNEGDSTRLNWVHDNIPLALELSTVLRQIFHREREQLLEDQRRRDENLQQQQQLWQEQVIATNWSFEE